MVESAKPIFGISGHNAHTFSVRSMMKRIRAAGGKPLYLNHRCIRPHLEVKHDVGLIDALIVMGNHDDIDPSRYIGRYAKDHPKAKAHLETRSELRTAKGRARAKYEEALLRLTLDCGIPLLGICGGMHRLNVLCGGTLHQHIPDLVGSNKHMQNAQGIALHVPVIPVIIKEETKLASVIGNIPMPHVIGCSAKRPKVFLQNSMHHQAVDRIAPHFRVCAVTDTVKMKDGTAGYLVEAIEPDPAGTYGKNFILGIQWHPEFINSQITTRIVTHMMVKAKEFRRLRHKKTRSPRVPPSNLHARSHFSSL